jgi:sigma-B regulation protein RsbU (phosphoserine phosphatase)
LIIPVLLFFRLQQGGKRLTMKLVNGFARRMHVYLIGKDSSAIDTIRDSLNDHGLKTIRQSMPELSKKARAIYIYMPDGGLPDISGVLPARRRAAKDILLFCHDPMFPSLRQSSLLTLPTGTPVSHVCALTRWLYKVCDALAVTKDDIMQLIYPNMSLVEKTEILTKEKEVLARQALELENALRELDYRNTKLVEELSLAGELQKSFLPKEYPVDLPLDFAHKYIPCEFIGGDLFEIIRLNDHTLGIIIADVSGHGVAAALLTAMFKSAFHHFAEGCFSPAIALTHIHKEFLETVHTEHYLTAFYAIIDTEAMCCSYCNAGHPRQILQRKDGKICELSTTGFFIGMLEETTFKDRKISLHPGDRLFFYTDGIIECKNGRGERFGRENLLKVIRQGSPDDISSVSNLIISELMGYIAELRFADDISLLITEVIESI